MEEQELYGKLFNTIPLLNDGHLEIMISTMDEKTALYYLTQAVNFAYQNGVYSLGECEIISKSIRLLHRPEITE
jgi:hypothetical protein